MLETFAHQGDGLRHAALHTGTRLVSLVSQGEEAVEQPLLWQLCLALQGYGYAPVVLDGTSLETPDCPGLSDLMDHAPCLPGSTLAADCSVMPAAAGLQRLARERVAQPPVARLARLLRGSAVAVLLARPELLMPVLAGSNAHPVLTVTPGRRAVVRGYRMLKQLQTQAGLAPALLALARDAAHVPYARSVGRTLQECATTHLGCHVDMTTVQSEPDPGRPGDDMRRLALRLLEGAVALGEGMHASYLN